MADAHFANVAEYLIARRAERNQSQEALAEALAESDPDFAGVDGLALSRWERGAVSPSIERQIKLMLFFGDEPHLLMGNREFEVRQLPSLASFHKWMGQHLQYNHVMGGHPYVDGDDGDFDKCGATHEHFPDWAELVCSYNRNLTRGRERWTPGGIQALIESNSSESLFYTQHGQLLGHLIMVRVDDSTLAALLRGDLLEHELSPDQLVDKGSKANLFALSAYFGNRRICEDAVTHFFQTLLESPKNMSLGFKARANFGVKLMDILDSSVIARGELITGHRDGARYNGKYYELVSYQVGREALISNPTILSIIRGR